MTTPDRERMRTLYVYILANRSRGLYVGVTNDIRRRVHEHRTLKRGFTGRYRCSRLVYVESVKGPRAAIAREKQLKGWLRAKKVALIESANPAWDDLAAAWYEAESADPSRRGGGADPSLRWGGADPSLRGGGADPSLRSG